MPAYTEILKIQTDGPGFVDITARAADVIWQAESTNLSQLHLFIRHTSASLIIQENADPSVLRDLAAWFERTAPWGEGAHRGLYTHDTEGPDDMPAHIRAMITNTSLMVPVLNRRMLLGTWQGIYLIEHRRGRHERQVVVQAV